MKTVVDRIYAQLSETCTLLWSNTPRTYNFMLGPRGIGA